MTGGILTPEAVIHDGRDRTAIYTVAVYALAQQCGRISKVTRDQNSQSVGLYWPRRQVRDVLR